MRRLLLVVISIEFVTLIGCRQDNCKNVTTYPKIDAQLFSYVFKTGSYWVYTDTVDGIIDSQYVYSYVSKIHYRDPQDTPNHLYQQVSPGGALSSTYCGPYYLDKLEEKIVSYQNGQTHDTMHIYATGSDDILSLAEHYNTLQTTTLGILQSNPKDTGLVLSGVGTLPGSGANDTIYLWYEGMRGTITQSAYTFNDVRVFRVKASNINQERFIYPTDLYFAAGYGIIKIVEHKPVGDVPWILTNYHIEN